MSWPELALVALVALLPLALTGRDAGDESEWASVRPGIALSYPADHGAHRAHQTEWWYLTGNVADAAGRRFGYQFTLFRRGLEPGPAPDDASPLRAREVLLGHLALTDVDRQRTHFAERMRRGGAPLATASSTDLALVLEDWSLRREPDDRLILRAADSEHGIGVELELAPSGPPVLHGAAGYSRKGRDPGNASAYMSWPRLSTAGRLRVGDFEGRVTGETWFDHEFGTSVLDDDVEGWDWFGLQLDDGSELMVFVLRRSENRPSPISPISPFSSGTWMAADGTPHVLGVGDFTLESRATWTSPRTGAVYPAGWILELPGHGLRLELEVLVSDAELVSDGSTEIVYWEGPVVVGGSASGRGYAELTGYAGSLAARF